MVHILRLQNVTMLVKYLPNCLLLLLLSPSIGIHCHWFCDPKNMTRNMHIIPMGPPCALNWWCAFDDCISMSTSHVWLPPNYLRWAADIRCHLDVFLLIHCFLVGPGERGGDGIWRDLPRWELEAKHPLNPTNTTNTTTNLFPPFFATQNNTEFYASSTSLKINKAFSIATN